MTGPTVVLLLLLLLVAVGAVAGLVALVVSLVRSAARRAKEREQELRSYAAQREWTYLPEDPRLLERFSGSPFGRGSGRRVTHVLHGTHDGRAVAAFEYAYTTSSGSGQSRSTTTHRYAVVATNLGLRTPSLSVSPQGGLDRLMGRIFGQDLQMGEPAFDDRFRISADDPRLARDVLHPGMTQLLLHRWPDLSWRLSVDSLLVLAQGSLQPARVEAALEATAQVLAQVPAQVWADLRAGQEPPAPKG